MRELIAGTVTGLMELAAGPVLAAVPERHSIFDQYQPDLTDDEIRFGVYSEDPADLIADAERHIQRAIFLEEMGAGEHGELNESGFQFFSVLLRGSVRAVLTGVYEDLPGVLDLRAYSDDEGGLLVQVRHPDRRWDFKGGADVRLPEEIVARLPKAPPGRAAMVRVPVSEDGTIDVAHSGKVDEVMDLLERPRSGTTVIDLVAFGGLCAEFPEHGFVLVDTDIGRYALAEWGGGDRSRELLLIGMTDEMCETFFRISVEGGRSRLP
ncbi:EspG family protein [Amycolatopsis xylanica]|uniref:EspG family protein n=1 Tax=Amycolatopsis xylanica TaxID=589385 RepID=A0A1H2Z6A5_9PSEU|nr:ESX secretion-associated protein EspG [Amycolatopsis xylanica]SDX12886.1 EspG family protein [Amycolatopsis xylanica]